MRLTGEPELIKWRDLHDTNVQLLPGLTEDIEWQELSRSTNRLYSGSQGSVGIKKVYNGSKYMPFMYNSYCGSCGSLETQNSQNVEM